MLCTNHSAQGSWQGHARIGHADTVSVVYCLALQASEKTKSTTALKQLEQRRKEKLALLLQQHEQKKAAQLAALQDEVCLGGAELLTVGFQKHVTTAKATAPAGPGAVRVAPAAAAAAAAAAARRPSKTAIGGPPAASHASASSPGTGLLGETNTAAAAATATLGLPGQELPNNSKQPQPRDNDEAVASAAPLASASTLGGSDTSSAVGAATAAGSVAVGDSGSVKAEAGARCTPAADILAQQSAAVAATAAVKQLSSRGKAAGTHAGTLKSAKPVGELLAANKLAYERPWRAYMKKKEPEKVAAPPANSSSHEAAPAAESHAALQGALHFKEPDRTDPYGHVVVSSKKRSADQHAALQVQLFNNMYCLYCWCFQRLGVRAV